MGGNGGMIATRYVPALDVVTRFWRVVESAFHVPLERLHERDKLPLFTRETDQCTCWHERFYLLTESPEWGSLYRHFVRHELAEWFPFSFYVQTVPTFRVQFPNNVAVGEFHRDVDYGHHANEITVWIPLTWVAPSQSVWFDGEPHPLRFGEILVFDAANKMHGNVRNETERTRVSFDLRVLPKEGYRPTEDRSVNTGKRFVVGDYFSEGT